MSEVPHIASCEELADYVADCLERQQLGTISSQTARRRTKAILDGLEARCVRFYSNYSHCMLPAKTPK